MDKQYLSCYREIGKRIRYFRNKRGMSQEELGKKIHWDAQFISRIEGDYDSRNISPYLWSAKSLELLFLIADALEMELPAFFLPMREETFETYRKDKPNSN